MKTRQADVEWIGDLMNGGGQVTSVSGALDETPFGFGSRFLDAPGTNPEELLAAAHASCFATHLGLLLSKHGTAAENVRIACRVKLSQIADDRVEIARSDISVDAAVDRITEQAFAEVVAEAGRDCPMSRALRIDVHTTGRLM